MGQGSGGRGPVRGGGSLFFFDIFEEKKILFSTLKRRQKNSEIGEDEGDGRICVSGTMTKRRDDAWSSSLVDAGGLIIIISDTDTSNTNMGNYTITLIWLTILIILIWVTVPIILILIPIFGLHWLAHDVQAF